MCMHICIYIYAYVIVYIYAIKKVNFFQMEGGMKEGTMHKHKQQQQQHYTLLQKMHRTFPSSHSPSKMHCIFIDTFTYTYEYMYALVFLHKALLKKYFLRMRVFFCTWFFYYGFFCFVGFPFGAMVKPILFHLWLPFCVNGCNVVKQLMLQSLCCFPYGIDECCSLALAILFHIRLA